MAQKIADFGLATVCRVGCRVASHQIATRWYRAPESLLGARGDSPALDAWACGCVLAELLRRVPLFAGDSDLDQLARIFAVRGAPNVARWPQAAQLPDFGKVEFVETEPVSLASVFPDCAVLAVDLVDRLLACDPAERMSLSEVEFCSFI